METYGQVFDGTFLHLQYPLQQIHLLNKLAEDGPESSLDSNLTTRQMSKVPLLPQHRTYLGP